MSIVLKVTVIAAHFFNSVVVAINIWIFSQHHEFSTSYQVAIATIDLLKVSPSQCLNDSGLTVA